MVKGVFFDFWGTLIENGIFPSPVKQAKFILRLDIPFVDYIQRFERSFMTKNVDTLSDSFKNVTSEFSISPPPFVIEKLVGMWNKNTLLAKPFSDTEETLKALKEKGIKIGLISNTDQFSVNQVLDKFNLREYFDAIVLSCDEGFLKCNPSLFSIALEKVGLQKEEVIMVGDSLESDIKGAEQAGITAVLIDRKDRRTFDPKITSLKDIISMTEQNE